MQLRLRAGSTGVAAVEKGTASKNVVRTRKQARRSHTLTVAAQEEKRSMAASTRGAKRPNNINNNNNNNNVSSLY